MIKAVNLLKVQKRMLFGLMKKAHLMFIRNAFCVPPGITGLAQIQNVDMSEPQRLAEIDQIYIRTRSLGGDLKLIFRTFFGG